MKLFLLVMSYQESDQVAVTNAGRFIKEANVDAIKLEGGDPEVDESREHVSDILEYFLSKKDILARGLMPALEQNYLDKHDAANRTADALTRVRIDVICAGNLHG